MKNTTYMRLYSCLRTEIRPSASVAYWEKTVLNMFIGLYLYILNLDFKKIRENKGRLKKNSEKIVILNLIFSSWKWQHNNTPFQDGDQVEVFGFGTDKWMEVISKIFTKDKAPFLEGITASNNLFGWIQGNGGQLTNDLREKTKKFFHYFTKNWVSLLCKL